MENVKRLVSEVDGTLDSVVKSMKMAQSTPSMLEQRIVTLNRQLQKCREKLELAKAENCRGADKKIALDMVREREEKIAGYQKTIDSYSAPVSTTNALGSGYSPGLNVESSYNAIPNKTINTGNAEVDVQVKRVGNTLAVQNDILDDTNRKIKEAVIISGEIVNVLEDDSKKLEGASQQIVEMNDHLSQASIINARIRKHARRTKIILYSITALLIIIDIGVITGYAVSYRKDQNKKKN